MTTKQKQQTAHQETEQWMKQYATDDALVICGLLWTQGEIRESVRLSVVGERIDKQEDDRYIVVSTFPQWAGWIAEADRWQLEGGIAKWVDEVWQRKDTESTIVWYSFEPGNRPDAMKFPGKWECTAHL